MSQVAVAIAPPESSRAPVSAEAATVVRHVAHELRQPLSTIESIAYYLELILPDDQPRAHQQLAKLQELVQQSNWIVTNAANFVQAGRPEPEMVDLEALLSPQIADIFDGGTAASVTFDSYPIALNLDPLQAQHLFRNLLTFFRQIVLDGDTIEIRASTTAELVAIEISAGTPGYSARAVKAMFEPFSAGLPAGSGLSLASVRRMVAAHGGEVEATADPARGVSVTVRFPR
jgi:signal transduction histidine kinase